MLILAGVYLHDPRCICKEAKTKTRRKNKEDVVLDSLFWPVMPYPMVAGKLDSSRQPHVIQSYSVPLPQADSYHKHDAAVYSMWMHFVDFCMANSESSHIRNNADASPCYSAPDTSLNSYTDQQRLQIFQVLSRSNGHPLSREQILRACAPALQGPTVKNSVAPEQPQVLAPRPHFNSCAQPDEDSLSVKPETVVRITNNSLHVNKPLFDFHSISPRAASSSSTRQQIRAFTSAASHVNRDRATSEADLSFYCNNRENNNSPPTALFWSNNNEHQQYNNSGYGNVEGDYYHSAPAAGPLSTLVSKNSSKSCSPVTVAAFESPLHGYTNNSNKLHIIEDDSRGVYKEQQRTTLSMLMSDPSSHHQHNKLKERKESDFPAMFSWLDGTNTDDDCDHPYDHHHPSTSTAVVVPQSFRSIWNEEDKYLAKVVDNNSKCRKGANWDSAVTADSWNQRDVFL